MDKHQVEVDIRGVLARMAELCFLYSIPYPLEVTEERGLEFRAHWRIPQAECTYNTYVRILAILTYRKIEIIGNLKRLKEKNNENIRGNQGRDLQSEIV